jgi:DNA-binding transcriptional LysR family regulator
MITHRRGLRTANLNLVPILRALLREGSITQAAHSLSLSPSAVSCALANLRAMMDDPLLVREGRTMKLTMKAEQLIPKVEQACFALEDILHEEPFDPRHTKPRRPPKLPHPWGGQTPPPDL